MKLFVKDSNSGKLYLNQVARTRNELASKLGGRQFVLQGRLYSVKDVVAESDNADTIGGAILGGLLGTFFGPGGVAIGGLLGGAIGNSSETEQVKRVATFNSSYV